MNDTARRAEAPQSEPTALSLDNWNFDLLPEPPFAERLFAELSERYAARHVHPLAALHLLPPQRARRRRGA